MGFAKFHLICLLLITFSWTFVKATSILPNLECPCDGTQYVFKHHHLTQHTCGRLAMCAFEMFYYMTKMPNVSAMPDNVLSATEYEAKYKKIMGLFGFPIYESIEYMIEECRVEFRNCADAKKLLVEKECARFRPQKEKEWAEWKQSGPWTGHEYFAKDTPFTLVQTRDFYFNWWRMYFDGWDKSRPINGFRYKTLDKRFFWGACPYFIIKPTFTMSVLLAEFAGVAFHEDMSVHVLAHHVRPFVIRALYCDAYGPRYTDMYMSYNATEFCKTWHISGIYVCISLTYEALDRQQRNVEEECQLPPLPPDQHVFVDPNDELNEAGKTDDPHWYYPDYPDYPETKWRPRHISFPWFPPYQSHPENEDVRKK